jgi:hypothetical protein
MSSNRYKEARRSIPLPRSMRRRLQRDIRDALSRTGTRKFLFTAFTFPGEKNTLLLICSVDLDRVEGVLREIEHVSVSCAGSLPSWEDLLWVRSICWPDDVYVYQIFPPLEGENREEWVNAHQYTLHLHHTRPVKGKK